MLGIIVFAAAGFWILVLLLVLGLCKDAKVGDEAVNIGRSRFPRVDGKAPAIELVVSRRDADPGQIPHLV